MIIKIIIGDIIDTMNNINPSKEFVKDFERLSRDLAPKIGQYMEEEKIHRNPALFFFASLVKNVLDSIEGKQEKENLTNAVTFYILDDIGDKSDKIH